MHWIQRHVLRQLILNPSLRYADIKPARIEGSLFMYHLRLLLRSGLVQKTTANRYELTAKGRLQADNLRLESLTGYEQPRLVVLIACWDQTGRLLLFRRRTQPVINMIGFPHVSTGLGRPMVAGAEQAFAEMSGLTVHLLHRGDGYITLYRGDEPESYVFFHLLEGFNPVGNLQATTNTGDLFWQTDLKFPASEYLPSMTELVALLRSPAKAAFFVELSFQLA